MAEELYQKTNPGAAAELGIGPTFDELLDVSRRYLGSRIIPLETDGAKSDLRDVGIYFWRRQALDVLDTAIRGAGSAGVEAVPILGSPAWLDTTHLRRDVVCYFKNERPAPGQIDRALDVLTHDTVCGWRLIAA